MSEIALPANTTILVIDDDPLYRELIRKMLESGDTVILEANDMESAWHLLSSNAILTIDVILLDRKLPDGDGLGLITRIRKHPTHNKTPIIVQSVLGYSSEIESAIRLGAYHYLKKPYQREILRALVRVAVLENRERKALTDGIEKRQEGMTFLTEAQFQIRTLEDANHLTLFLAQFFPNPKNTAIGIAELLINAVEHGNLEIDYQTKGKLLQNNSWSKEISRRLADPKFRNRKVDIAIKRLDNHLELTIRDEGPGFAWECYEQLGEAQMFDLHGRGILIAKNCFDGVTYEDRGNQVRCWSSLD